MLSRIAALIGLLCFSLAGAAQERSIEAVFAEHVKAVQSRDLAALERTITSGEQLTLILPNGVQTGIRAVAADSRPEHSPAA